MYNQKIKLLKSKDTLQWWFLILLLSLTLASCAGILTKSQLTEIKKFSAASNAYSEYPGTVMKTHAGLSLNNQLTNASESKNGETALKNIYKGIEKKNKYNKLADRADKACEILKSYSSILQKLSSDQYINDTQASLEKLGKSLDKSIGEYNKLSNSSFSTFGGIIAATLRGVASIYIKTEQHKAIKKAVNEADPMIEDLSASIIKLLDLYVGEDGAQIIQSEKEDLENWYKDAGHKQPLSTTQWVAKELEAIDNLILLVNKSKIAATNLRDAHKTLLTKIQKKTDLKDSIEIIEILIDDVEAAKDLKDKIEG